MLCVHWSDRFPSMSRCISIAMLFPIRRVRRSCTSFTISKDSATFMISFSISSGSDFSSSSLMLLMIILRETLIMNTLTTMAAIGSRTTHLSPRKIAPPIPTAVPIEEKASLR